MTLLPVSGRSRTRRIEFIALSPVKLDHVPDIRLIACDLDGTLLDDGQAIHEDFWPLVHQLHARGIIFCPASGRQYFNLLERFRPIAEHAIFIAENGAYVVHQGRELSSNGLSRSDCHELVRVTRTLRSRGADVGAVLCGKRSAYIERSDPEFRAEAAKYNHRLAIVDDLLAVEDEYLKVAIFDFDSSERVTAPAFVHFRRSLQVVISGKHWLDVMAPHAHKGAGIRHIQKALAISREQTMVFGDFLNDLEMMGEADYSFAMANAHPLLKAHARFTSPGNNENGVVRTIKTVLGIK